MHNISELITADIDISLQVFTLWDLICFFQRDSLFV